MLNMYALEAQLHQHTEALRQDAERALRAVERRGDPAAQIVRPASAQYGARIWRFRSFPAWSRGSSTTKSTDRGRL